MPTSFKAINKKAKIACQIGVNLSLLKRIRTTAATTTNGLINNPEGGKKWPSIMLLITIANAMYVRKYLSQLRIFIAITTLVSIPAQSYSDF